MNKEWFQDEPSALIELINRCEDVLRDREISAPTDRLKVEAAIEIIWYELAEIRKELRKKI